MLAKLIYILSSSWCAVVARPVLGEGVDPSAGAATANGVDTHFIIIGGYQQLDKSHAVLFKTVDIYSKNSNSSSSIPDLPESRCGHGSASVNGLLYVVGGFNKLSEVMSTVYVYSPVGRKWSLTTPMQTARTQLGVASLENKIYAVGGSALGEQNGATNTVEVFDPTTTKWTSAKNMFTKRQNHAVGVLGGHLYIIGGINENMTLLNSAERYDPKSNEWFFIEPMKYARCSIAVGVLNDEQLYAINGLVNGKLGEHTTTSVEVYNAKTKKWSSSMRTQVARSGAAAFSSNGQLYIVGGMTNSASHGTQALTSVERFDPGANLWVSDEYQLSKARWYVSVAML